MLNQVITMCSELYLNENYISEFKFINASYIREYDLAKANISALLYKNAITPDLYKILYEMDKDTRERTVGLMIRDDPKLNDIKSNGIIEAKRLLFEMNNIDDFDVLEIRNDAVFIIGNKLKYTKVNEFFNFIIKSEFTTYAFISNKLSLFYKYDPITDTDIIDIKGIKNHKLELHANHFLKFICESFYKLQNDTLDNTLKYISNFYHEYMSRNLDIEYYRSFDADCIYKFPYKDTLFGVDNIVEKDNTHFNKMNLNIDINVYIIRTLYSYISELYFNQKKR